MNLAQRYYQSGTLGFPLTMQRIRLDDAQIELVSGNYRDSRKAADKAIKI